MLASQIERFLLFTHRIGSHLLFSSGETFSSPMSWINARRSPCKLGTGSARSLHGRSTSAKFALGRLNLRVRRWRRGFEVRRVEQRVCKSLMTIRFVLCPIQLWRILLRRCDVHTTSALSQSRLRNSQGLSCYWERTGSLVWRHRNVVARHLLFSSTGWYRVRVTPNKRCLTWRLYEVQ